MKINKHVLTLLFSILLSGITFSQNTSFSKVIAPIENVLSASFLATGIVKQDNNYILSLTGFDTASVAFVNDLQSLYFAKVDSNGENFQILNKYVVADTNFYVNWGALISIHNGGFCYICDIDSIYDNKPQHLFMLFDNSMNNILTKIIPHDTIWEAIRQLKETHDQGFILVGSRYVNDISGTVLIIKTDSLGNQLWKKTIDLDYISSGWQVEETPDNGFLISGINDSYTTNKVGSFLIKTDSTGNLIWSKYLGNPALFDDGFAACAITQDSNYIVALGYATYNYPWPNDNYLKGRLNIIKYAPDGTQIWNKMCDSIKNEYTVTKIQMLPNNDFIVMGSSITGIDTCYYGTFMFKFNSNGDSLWSKIYSFTHNYMDGNYLIDNVLNSDGSITACGYVNGDNLSPYEQIWILKTDSNGYAPGCEPTGIEEIQYIKAEGIKIYPNPANTQFTIAFKDVMNSNAIVELYGSMGNMVLIDYMQKGTYIKNIDVSKLNSGLYFYNISINGAKVSSGKLTILNN